MPLLNKHITIPFQAIKSVNKDTSGSGKNMRQIVDIEYITDDEDTQEVEVYAGQILNFFTRKNQQRRYGIFSCINQIKHFVGSVSINLLAQNRLCT